MKRSPLRYRSKKTARAYIQRRQLVDRLLKERPFCEIKWDDQCWGKAIDVHERKRRSQGGRIVGDPDEAYMTACRYCHDKVGANPAESFARGFAIHSWQEINVPNQPNRSTEL